ncbi:MAG: undecaprenyl-diphosphate phosphatase [Candidatus Wildermuthbacteria bacterium]|nr:undecaprenyl-diphosphate phosphatase [Candidatus Wildermuthbacteria bacterium]
MFEGIVLGAIQGIAEWLPISSEAAVIWAQELFFGGKDSQTMLQMALFLHLGTALASIVYFRKEIVSLLKKTIRYREAYKEDKKFIQFLFLATLVSGGVGLAVYALLSEISDTVESKGFIIRLGIGILLLVTAFLQFRAKKGGIKGANDLRIFDGIVLGVLQGLAVLPGISRSGITVSALLLRKFDDVFALRASFLMSIPIVLAGGVFIGASEAEISLGTVIGLAASFIFGLATIHILLKIAKKINFAYFVLFFAALVLLSAFVG